MKTTMMLVMGLAVSTVMAGELPMPRSGVAQTVGKGQAVADGLGKGYRFAIQRYENLHAVVPFRNSGKEKVRLRYQLTGNPDFTIDVPADGKFHDYELVCGPVRKGEFLLSFETPAGIEFGDLEFRKLETDALPEGNDLTILPPVAKKPRIVVRDVGYVPERPGEAEVLLWKGDAVAAVTFTVDDNHVQDHSWWMDLAAKYGARITWFQITENIGINNGRSPNGKWEDWKNVLAKGHDFQSHTFDHLHHREMPIADVYRLGIERNQEKIPEHRIICMAYPGGGQTAKNSCIEAAKHFICCRGARPFPNEPGAINYMSTGSGHGDDTVEDATNRFGIANIVTRNPKFPQYYRAWNCYHCHNMATQQMKDGVERAMRFFRDHGVWLAGYADVARYGQERDTARIETVENGAEKIVLKLTDRMKDDLFDYPLSLVLRVPDDWQAVEVGQGGKSSAVEVKRVSGKSAVTFEAIPDRGEIVVKKAR